MQKVKDGKEGYQNVQKVKEGKEGYQIVHESKRGKRRVPDCALEEERHALAS